VKPFTTLNDTSFQFFSVKRSTYIKTKKTSEPHSAATDTKIEIQKSSVNLLTFSKQLVKKLLQDFKRDLT